MPLRPGTRALEGTRRLQHTQVPETAGDDLEPDGEPVRSEAARTRRRREASQVERIAEPGPAQPVPRMLLPMRRDEALRREGGNRQRGCEQQIVAPEEGAHLVVVEQPFALCSAVVACVVGHAMPGQRDEPGIHLVLPLVERCAKQTRVV